MKITLPSGARPLFRDADGALPNTLMLSWTTLGWLASFPLMAAPSPWLNGLGTLLCLHTMVLAAYAIHEAAHYTLFSSPDLNRRAGEWLSFMAGSSYASFERIRHLHIRHHRDRADLTCFDFKGLMRSRPALKRALQLLEWAYIPATELLMHLQVVWRPFFVRSQRRSISLRSIRKKAASSTADRLSVSGKRFAFERLDGCDRVLAARSAHRGQWTQAPADLGTLRLSEDRAAIVVCELHAAHAGRLAVRHARDRRADRGRDAAGAATGATFHGGQPRSMA